MWICSKDEAINMQFVKYFYKYNEKQFYIRFHFNDSDYTFFSFENEKERDDIFQHIITNIPRI